MAMKSIQVPEEFHAYVKAHKRADETMGEALIRLAGGPHPEVVAGLLSEDTAEAMHETIEERSAADRESRARVRRQFRTTDDP